MQSTDSQFAKVILNGANVFKVVGSYLNRSNQRL